MEQVDKAIILKRISYGESDHIVSFFSKQHGRMSGIAKSAKKSQKRFGSSLEPGTVAELSFQKGKGDLFFLKEAKTDLVSVGLSKSYIKSAVLQFFLELSLRFLPEEQAADDKFEYMFRFLTYLHQHEPSLRDVLRYSYHWLKLCGYEPSFLECSLCQEHFDIAVKKKWMISSDFSHLLCSSCREIEDQHDVSEMLSFFQQFRSGLKTELHQQQAAFQLLMRYTEHILDKKLKTVQYLDFG